MTGGKSSNKKLDNLFRLQKKEYVAQSDPIVSKLQILKLTDLLKLNIALLMNNYMNDRLPLSFDGMF